MKKLSTWLIIIGLIIIAIPFAGKAYINYQQEKLLAGYEEYLAEESEEDAPSIMDEGFSDDVTATAAAAAAKVAEKKPPENVIGRVKISCIKSNQLLLEGSSSKELRYGAGHVAGTAMPGELGNCSIAGHRNYTFGSYFSRLDEVSPGDKIVVEYKGDTYTYIMEESFVVLPTDTGVLSQPSDKKQITLITCTPKGSNTHRLIVRGSLEGFVPKEESPEEPAETDPALSVQTQIPSDTEGQSVTDSGGQPAPEETDADSGGAGDDENTGSNSQAGEAVSPGAAQ